MSKMLNEYTKEELIELVRCQKKTIAQTKKFGLVWEDKPEKVATDCEKKLPVIKEVVNKAINEADASEPTNLIIEGDNYHALSVLNYTHAKKIDVIYIDPPYNTGNKDFTYNDRYVDGDDSFKHSKWLSFMEKRLRLAQNLLKKDGLILISIDDNEQANLRLLCNQIFGEENLVAQMPRKTTEHMRVNASYEMQNLNDYVLAYSNSRKDAILNKKSVGEIVFPYEDEKGKYMLKPFQNSGANGTRTARPNLYYPIYYNEETKSFALEPVSNSDIEILPKKVKSEDGRWLWSKKKFLLDNKMLEYRNNTIFRKDYYDANSDITKYESYKSWLDGFPNRLGAASLKKLGLDGMFDYSKPPELIKFLIELTANKDATILDFFAGSGTTGQAVLELNKEDGGHRHFILCTNNENQIAEKVTHPRIKIVITGTRIDGSKYSDGLPANARYFKTEFIDKDETMDKLRRELSSVCEDMIRVREGAYEKIIDDDMLKVFKNARGLTAIIYDRFELAEHIERIEALETDAPVHLYVFSYSKSDRKDEMPEGLKHKYKTQPIPEGVLEIYKKIFANIKGGEKCSI